ncbi:MAG: hypothetical protein R3250_17765 [Melioribacteraceae bacterium]|nr:hypothetical protein [Melioribacteraceae bacterium]
MKPRSIHKINQTILWIARIWGGLSLAFLVFMVGANLIEAIFGSSEGGGFNSTAEYLSFLCFPIGIMVGLALALKWEGLGGIITVLAMVGFHIIHPDLIGDLMMDGLMAPGVLFLIYWFLKRKYP